LATDAIMCGQNES